MNREMKFVILAAAAGGFTSGSSYAQSSVTLYGIVDTGLGYTHVSGPSLNTHAWSAVDGVENGSRFGMTGREALGNGWIVGFTLENGFSADTGALKQGGRMFGRKSIVTVDNPAWGSLQIGRQSNITTKYFGAIDPFYSGFGESTMGTTFSAANVQRYDNMVLYQSPSFYGFSVGFDYSLNVDATNTAQTGVSFGQNTRAMSVGTTYTNGPIYAAFTYDRLIASDAPTAKLNTQAKPQEYIFGLRYDFSIVKLAAAWSHTSDGWFATATLPSGTPSVTTTGYAGFGAANLFADGFAANSYMLGATVVVNPATSILGIWQRAEPTNNKLTGGDSPMSVWAIGGTYFLSKRTNLYGYVSYATNYAFMPRVKSTGATIGIDHAF